jgi:uncharacterized membrane protein YeaQ/YmgE (transglycosylase-associated protein family)
MFDFIAAIPYGLLIGFVTALLVPFGSQRGCVTTFLIAAACGAGFGALVLSHGYAASPAVSTAFFALCGAALGILVRFARDRH